LLRMIDTVRFWQPHELRKNWKKSHRGMIVLDRPAKFRAHCTGYGEFDWFEVSLPRLLFGTNRKLITSQRQITNALDKADQIIRQVAKPSSHIRRFSRVDLVWHFYGSPAKFFFAHREADHPEIDKRMSAHRNKRRQTGITWAGERMRINMYDKTDRRRSFPLWIVRVEVQLHTAKLREKFQDNPVSALSFCKCYQIYRSVVIKFHPHPVPKIHSKDEALFLADQAGVPVMQHLNRTLSERSMQTMRKKRTNFILQSSRIDWRRLLPTKPVTPPFN